MANKVTITSTDNKITVTPQNTNTSISTTTNSVTVNQGTTKTVQINTPGPAGSAGLLSGGDALLGDITSSGNISSSGTLFGSGLNINGPSNSNVSVGTYEVGFDTANANNFQITGSGLIISGAMADDNHHNMVKIGNVELIDLSNAATANEFLIHNVNSFNITTGSDGGNLTTAGTLFEHNGPSFVISADGSNTPTTAEGISYISNVIYLNASNGVNIGASGGDLKLRSDEFESSSINPTDRLLIMETEPFGNTPIKIENIRIKDILLTGAPISASHITASSNISASGYIQANEYYLDLAKVLFAEEGNFKVGNTVTPTVVEGSSITLNANVTASGNISASGDIIGATFGNSSGNIIFTGDVSGSINSSYFGDEYNAHGGDANSGFTLLSLGGKPSLWASGASLKIGNTTNSTQTGIDLIGEVTASANISASGTGSFEHLTLNYDNMPTADPSIKGVVYRSSSAGINNLLFISTGA